MGCTVSTGGASGHEAVAAGDTTIATAPSAGSGNVLSVFVRGAAGLRDADGGLAGGSDAYCALRVGPKGSNFKAKSEDTERFSSTAIGYESPKWNFASRVAGVQPGDAALELHVIVMDRDAFDSALPLQIAQIEAAEKQFLVKDINEEWRRGHEDALSGAWDGDRRLEVLDGDGLAGEIIFPGS